MKVDQLKHNITMIHQSVEETCHECKRSASEVTTICVSKSVDGDITKAVVELGILHLAENRIDKLLKKKELLKENSDITWHFIGHLQRRKVKSIINEIDYFHALDTLSLAQEINKRANHPINCFVQVNVSGEASKQGVSPEDLPEFIDQLNQLERIRIVGLMTMAPIDASNQQLIDYFSHMKDLQQRVYQSGIDTCVELSMGMSRDFKEAIECGATYLRIGTDFFIDVEG